MALTLELSGFVENMQYENIPDEAVSITKMVLCDFLGVAIAGKNEEGPQILKEYVLEQEGSAECSVPGYAFKTNPMLSALLCGTMGHALDYDDGALSMSGHAGVVLGPVIWALGNKYNITGKKAIEAFLAGFEGASLVGKFNRSEGRGPLIWHMTKALGVIGATLTAAKIMDLSTNQIRAALGIAASLSGGMIRNFGTMMKPFHAGSAAHNGIMAATLAQKGFSSNLDILETDRGFRRIFAQEGEQPEAPFIEMMRSGRWDITSDDGGVVFKLYPSCGGTHRSIHDLIELANKENINPDDVESVIVRTQGWIFTIAHITEPKTGLEGKFSVEYTAAAALTDRNVTMEHFTNEKFKQLEPLIKKVRRDPINDRSVPSAVIVTMKDGRVFTKTASLNERFPGNPMTWELLFAKFRACMAHHFSQEDTGKIEDMLFHLEELDQFNKLVSLLCK